MLFNRGNEAIIGDNGAVLFWCEYFMPIGRLPTPVIFPINERAHGHEPKWPENLRELEAQSGKLYSICYHGYNDIHRAVGTANQRMSRMAL